MCDIHVTSPTLCPYTTPLHRTVLRSKPIIPIYMEIALWSRPITNAKLCESGERIGLHVPLGRHWYQGCPADGIVGGAALSQCGERCDNRCQTMIIVLQRHRHHAARNGMFLVLQSNIHELFIMPQKVHQRQLQLQQQQQQHAQLPTK